MFQIFKFVINCKTKSFSISSAINLDDCETKTFSSTDLRNKLRYLKHLPVTSAFEVCELDMDIPKFSSEVLDEFKVN